METSLAEHSIGASPASVDVEGRRSVGACPIPPAEACEHDAPPRQPQHPTVGQRGFGRSPDLSVMPPAQLSGAQRHTYEELFREPVSGDLPRGAVRSMLRALGQVCTTPDQNEEARRNGHVLILRAQETTAMETAENVLALRHFLTRSDRPAETTNGRDAHLLLVIGRSEFCLFRTDVYGGCVEQLLGDEEQGDYAAAVVAAEAGDGAAMLGPCTFFEPIAKALERTGRILVVGESCGSRLEMDHFFGWLTRQHPDLAGRIVGSLVLSEAATAKTGRLLERARDYFTHVRGV